tara:strand:+ start:126 stop:488 length:363 start_codon:yes stop_codon:yes gene_type:complete
LAAADASSGSDPLPEQTLARPRAYAYRIGVAAFAANAGLEGVTVLAVSGDFAGGAAFAGGAGASSLPDGCLELSLPGGNLRELPCALRAAAFPFDCDAMYSVRYLPSWSAYPVSARERGQ